MSDGSRPGEPVERARTIPASWYVDPGHHAREIEAIFARTWQPVLREDQVARPGDYATATVAGEPLVVVRGRDGVLRALSNVCRHRAGTVVLGEGSAKAFSCTYHGWAYGLDGALLAAPEMEGVEGFAVEDCRLPSFRCEAALGHVFVNLDANAPSLAEALDPLPALAAATAFSRMRFTRRDVYEIACDWKVYVDNYLEGYHIPRAHPGLNEAIDYKRYETRLSGPLVIQETPGRDGRGTGPEFLYVWAWPNFMLNVSPGYAQTNLILPDGPGRTRCLFDYFLPDGAEEAGIFAWSDGIQKEDVAICEAVQRNLVSRTYESGRYSAKREAGVWAFHERLRRALG